ncbi:MFS transporter [Bailinhaonella thermotolerans]|uniref:MFS transporter n=1 Tax=Bailinhaonella thermotolerans TaxID=1070861 RepID=A0A3A4ACC5_9ACTN|nr:MFS transporter [Bailinhaonella thermotolerans]RJL24194.1 MFS transporter [Bailinhaonella thermotolerans]
MSAITVSRPVAVRGPASARPGSWAALPVLLVPVFMTTLDFFIANVAMPSLRRDLGAGPAAAQFVIAAYGLAYATGLITAGRLGDLFGRRRVFTAGLALFTAASVWCGLAPTPGLLIAGRVAQGLAAALLAPQVLALIGALYPGERRARAFGWYGTAVGFAGVSGQAIGGFLVAADPAGLGWRTCFLVNLPAGLIALALTRRLVPDVPAPGAEPGSPAEDPRGVRAGAAAGGHAGKLARLDPFGAALLAAGLLAVVFPLVHGGEHGFSAWTWATLGAAAPILGGFAAWQRRRMAAGREPLLDPAVFRERGFALGLLAVMFLFGTSAGVSFVVAIYLQEGLGMGPLAAGTVFTALNAGFFLTSTQTSRLGRRLGPRLPVAGALGLAAGLGLIAHAVSGGATPAGLVPGLFLAGSGMGLVMAPLISMVLEGVRQRHAGVASGVLGTAQETAGALGVTIVGAVFFGALHSTGASWEAALRTGLLAPAGAALGIAVLVLIRTSARRSTSVDDT